MVAADVLVYEQCTPLLFRLPEGEGMYEVLIYDVKALPI